jgi:hypothetical protein
MKNFWSNIPEQIKLLSVLIIIIAIAFVVVTSILVPDDFGEYGHYRTSAVEEVISQKMMFGGQELCFECHDDMVTMKNAGFHKDVSCEVCHGPAAKHAEEPGSVELQAPRERGYCPLCHEYISSRPTGFPQIVSASHNPMKPCISCHEPHNPEPPETPKNCSACHAEIARTKSVSHHVYVTCSQCHTASEEHKINPRSALPSKPIKREFCGQCHAKNAQSDRGVPRIDLETHNPKYVCWQCHYSHIPESK